MIDNDSSLDENDEEDVEIIVPNNDGEDDDEEDDIEEYQSSYVMGRIGLRDEGSSIATGLYVETSEGNYTKYPPPAVHHQ